MYGVAKRNGFFFLMQITFEEVNKLLFWQLGICATWSKSWYSVYVWKYFGMFAYCIDQVRITSPMVMITDYF